MRRPFASTTLVGLGMTALLALRPGVAIANSFKMLSHQEEIYVPNFSGTTTQAARCQPFVVASVVLDRT